jgi:hypothetical protein
MLTVSMWWGVCGFKILVRPSNIFPWFITIHYCI